jgi:chaperonin GroEL
MLEDIAVLTGGKVIAEEAGMKIENTTSKDLGKAKKIVIDKDKQRSLWGGEEGDRGRIRQIKAQIDETTS